MSSFTYEERPFYRCGELTTAVTEFQERKQDTKDPEGSS